MSCVNYVQGSLVLPYLHTAGNETTEQVYNTETNKTAAKLVKLVEPLLHCGHKL
jgi:hypothetical protein